MSTIEGPLLSTGFCLTAPGAPLQHEGSFRPHQFPPSMSTIEEGHFSRQGLPYGLTAPPCSTSAVFDPINFRPQE
jgi:hypothetical protein